MTTEAAVPASISPGRSNHLARFPARGGNRGDISAGNARSPNDEGSIPNNASKLVTELEDRVQDRINYRIEPIGMSCGALTKPANGLYPNAKNAPAEPPIPNALTTRLLRRPLILL